jgi:hypothetical protein
VECLGSSLVLNLCLFSVRTLRDFVIVTANKHGIIMLVVLQEALLMLLIVI